MTDEERQQWQDMMKDLMVIKEEVAALQQKIFDLYQKIDGKLDGGENLPGS